MPRPAGVKHHPIAGRDLRNREPPPGGVKHRVDGTLWSRTTAPAAIARDNSKIEEEELKKKQSVKADTLNDKN